MRAAHTLQPAPTPEPRRWRTAPPGAAETEVFEAVGILDEVPGALGLILWQSLRDLGRWARAATEQRDELFAADAFAARLSALEAVDELPSGIAEPLRALAVMLSLPGVVSADVLRLAAERVSRWAEEHAAPITARAYAGVMVRIAAPSAGAALWMGQLSLRGGEPARAELWLREAVLRARAARDRSCHAEAYLALGRLAAAGANAPLAARCWRRAARLAERYTLPVVGAAAFHELARLAAAELKVEEAVHCARRALRFYDGADPALRTLACEVAALWVRAGQFAHALPVLRHVWPGLPEPLRPEALAALLRSAGALRDRQAFEQFWPLLFSLAAALRPEQRLQVARGALSLGDTTRARTLAQAALDEARCSGDADAERSAASLLLLCSPTPPVPPAVCGATEVEQLRDALCLACGGER